MANEVADEPDLKIIEETDDNFQPIWFNAAYVAAQRAGQVPIELGKKEQKNGKLNPKR